MDTTCAHRIYSHLLHRTLQKEIGFCPNQLVLNDVERSSFFLLYLMIQSYGVHSRDQLSWVNYMP